jgi:hypothetical protein
VLMATTTVTSPSTQMACAPREASESTASPTPALSSTLASNKVIPSCLHTSRALTKKARELGSEGFHGTPTSFNPGNISRAIRNASPTGTKLPIPTRLAGWSKGFDISMPTPAAAGSATAPKICTVLWPRLALASVCIEMVLEVRNKSKFPFTNTFTMELLTEISPSELYL